jgi:hypothetical protein
VSGMPPEKKGIGQNENTLDGKQVWATICFLFRQPTLPVPDIGFRWADLVHLLDWSFLPALMLRDRPTLQHCVSLIPEHDCTTVDTAFLFLSATILLQRKLHEIRCFFLSALHSVLSDVRRESMKSPCSN